jgi:hypothetical protein
MRTLDVRFAAQPIPQRTLATLEPDVRLGWFCARLVALHPDLTSEQLASAVRNSRSAHNEKAMREGRLEDAVDERPLSARDVRRLIERARLQLGRPPRPCGHCGQALRPGRRSDARYHEACRAKAWRRQKP